MYGEKSSTRFPDPAFLSSTTHSVPMESLSHPTATLCTGVSPAAAIYTVSPPPASSTTPHSRRSWPKRPSSHTGKRASRTAWRRTRTASSTAGTSSRGRSCFSALRTARSTRLSETLVSAGRTPCPSRRTATCISPRISCGGRRTSIRGRIAGCVRSRCFGLRCRIMAPR